MRGRRVISLLLSLVMALSLCSGVWATAEGGGDPAPAQKTQSDAGYEFVINKENDQNDKRTLYFFNQIDDGYMTYNRNVTGFRVNSDKIAAIRAYPLNANDAIFLAFKYDGSLGEISEGADVSSIINEHVDTENGKDAKFSVTYMNTDDTNLYVIKLTAKEALGTNGNMNFFDFSFCVGTGESRQEYQFAMEFGEGNKPQNTPLTDFKGVLADNEAHKDENDNSRLTEAQKNAANDYVDKYLLNGNGYVKNGDSDTTGVPLKDGKDYSAAEVAAIKAAVKAFREAEWQVHDALGNVQGVQIENGWIDSFGRYLAELASRVGISLWSDDVQDGVEAAVGNYTVTLYTNGDYGVFSLDTAAKVSVDNDKYTMSWDYEQIFFKVACSDENESRPALSYNNDTVQSIYHEGDRMEDGKKVYIYRVQLKRSNQEREVEFTIGNGESAPKFTVKFVDPNPWNPNDAFEAANAPAYVQELYKLGYRTPAYSTNFHLELPWQLHGTDNPSADGHWDYKWNFDEATGIITIEVNSDHEDCWKNCVGTDAVLPDGVYFHYWIGGSNNMDKPMKYGAHNGIDFTPDNLPDGVDLDNTILTADYENNNGWQLATVNQRSTTSTVMTFKEGTICRIETIAMSDVDAKKGEPMNSAETKYVIQINVVTDKTKAVKLETEESQNVPKDRIAFNTVGSVPAVEWKNTTVPEDGKVFALYSGANGDYTKAAAATGDFNGKPFSNMIGLVSIKVPDGYTTLNYVVDDHSENYISSYNYEYAPINLKATGLTSVRFPVFKTHYNSIKLVWSNDVTGKTLTESLLVEMGNATPWMGLLGEDGVTSTPAETIMNGQTEDFLQENGITVTYDKNLGYFSTRVDASKLKDLSALNYAVDLTPMQGAAYFKVFGFGGSEAPFAHGQERADLAEANLNDRTTRVIPVSDLNSGALGFFTQLLQTDSIKINVGNDELTVYFAANQLFRGGVIQWLDENENVLGYTYVYGRNGDFVTSVPTETKPEVNEAVGAPTLEWNGQGDPGFTCDRNPQTGGNGSKVFFQFSVKHTNGIDAQHKAVIYLPYDYFGITAAEGMRRAARGERPVIYHYLDESCANEPEVIYGEYTPYGVKFETGSFSPFVVDCSTTSTPHRYHSTTAAKADSPETFDGGIALYGALAVISLAGMAYVTKKRED